MKRVLFSIFMLMLMTVTMVRADEPSKVTKPAIMLDCPSIPSNQVFYRYENTPVNVHVNVTGACTGVTLSWPNPTIFADWTDCLWRAYARKNTAACGNTYHLNDTFTYGPTNCNNGNVAYWVTAKKTGCPDYLQAVIVVIQQQ